MALKHAIFLWSLAVLAALGTLRVHLWAQTPVNPVERLSEEERSFEAFLKTRFQQFNFSPALNFSGAAALVAIPMVKSPVNEMSDLASGVSIGGLYVTSGSPRLKLEPGAYRVDVAKEPHGWMASFIDDKGRVRAKVPAKVKEADPTDVPWATFEYSVCYRFDRTMVCV